MECLTTTSREVLKEQLSLESLEPWLLLSSLPSSLSSLHFHSCTLRLTVSRSLHVLAPGYHFLHLLLHFLLSTSILVRCTSPSEEYCTCGPPFISAQCHKARRAGWRSSGPPPADWPCTRTCKSQAINLHLHELHAFFQIVFQLCLFTDLMF